MVRVTAGSPVTHRNQNRRPGEHLLGGHFSFFPGWAQKTCCSISSPASPLGFDLTATLQILRELIVLVLITTKTLF